MLKKNFKLRVGKVNLINNSLRLKISLIQHELLTLNKSKEKDKIKI
jgi:hypothetical protein